METGDEQAGDVAGFGNENSRGIDRRQDDISSAQRQPGRSRAPSLKVRENRVAEVEAQAIAVERSRRAPLKDKTNLLSPIQDDESSTSSSPSAQTPTTTPRSLNNSDSISTASPLLNNDDVHAPSKADRFNQAHRPDACEARTKCDFTSIESVNHWFPPYSGKGSFNVPFSLIGQATDPKRRATIVREWRMLTTKQQEKKWDDILAKQQKKNQRSHNPRQMSIANSPNGCDETQQPRYSKRRRTLEDDKNESEDDDAWNRIFTSIDREFERKERRNKKGREKTQQIRQQKVRNNYDWLVFIVDSLTVIIIMFHSLHHFH